MLLHKLMEITFTKSIHAWSWNDFGDYLVVLLMDHHDEMAIFLYQSNIIFIFNTNLPIP